MRARPCLALVAVFAAFLAGCGAGPDGRGTREMAARLSRIADTTDPEANTYASEQRAKYLRSMVARQRAGAPERAQLERLLAVELVAAGRTEEAVEILEGLRGRIPDDVLDPDLAIAFIRLGEQENCVEGHTIDSCLFPIRDAGVHRLPRGSRSALGVYRRLLDADPEDLASRWLLNVAAMTLGSYPDGVPDPWRIPPTVFESEYDVGRFPDAAAGLGLDVLGLSGGAALEDFDGDGYLDVLCSSWGMRDPVRYFRNGADGTFADRTAEAGLTGITGGLNLVHADYDNDGDADVLLLRGAWLGFPPATDGGRHPNSLLANGGDGTFADVTEWAGLLSLHPTQTAAWGDLDGDGWLDLFVGNESFGEAVHPCEVFRSEGDGTFRDVAAEWGADLVGMVKGVACGDYDNDGDLDLYASRLQQPNILLRNESGGEFTDVTREARVAEPLRSFPTWFFDHDNDGWLDLFVSGYGMGKGGVAGSVLADYLGLPHGAETPRLYKNRRNGRFGDVTAKARLDKVLFTMGSNFGDIDGDGWLDLYLGTGDPDLRSIVPNRMFRNASGKRFQDVTTSGGFGHLQKGHGIAFGDIDSDGDQDVYAVMGGALEGDVYPNALFENPGHGNAWVVLELEGTRSNRSAIGARIAVTCATSTGERTVHVTVGTGGSFGSSSLRQEIGLGAATSIRSVEVTWPGATEPESVSGVDLRGAFRILEGEGRGEPLEYRAVALAGDAEGHVHH